jgi:formate/nitrite transporter FocA (FNT family)
MFEGFLRNLIPVTIGNLVGGSGFVGAIVYLRTRQK